MVARVVVGSAAHHSVAIVLGASLTATRRPHITLGSARRAATVLRLGLGLRHERIHGLWWWGWWRRRYISTSGLAAGITTIQAWHWGVRFAPLRSPIYPPTVPVGSCPVVVGSGPVAVGIAACPVVVVGVVVVVDQRGAYNLCVAGGL